MSLVDDDCMKCSLPKTGIFRPGLIPSRQKTMTKSFGKRDFMQPKGRVNMHSGGGGDLIVFFPCSISAPAISPGEKQFWKRKIHAGNG